MNKRQTPLPDDERKNDPKLQQLCVELDGVEVAMDRAMFRVEWAALNKRRSELLGDIKKRERELN